MACFTQKTALSLILQIGPCLCIFCFYSDVLFALCSLVRKQVEIPLIHMLFTIVNHWKRIWTMTLRYRHGRNPSMICILKEKLVVPRTDAPAKQVELSKNVCRIFDDINCKWWYILTFVSTDIWYSNSTCIYILCFTPVVSINSDTFRRLDGSPAGQPRLVLFWGKLLAICGFRRILGYPPNAHPVRK